MGCWAKVAFRTGVVAAIVAGVAITAVFARGGAGTPRTAHRPLLSSASVSARRAAAPQRAAAAKAGQPIVLYAPPALSPPLRDLPQASPTVLPRPETFEVAKKQAPAPGLPFIDPAAQTVPGPSAPSTPLVSFDGASNRDNFLYSLSRNSSRPPDNNGDVGPNHYVEWINTVIDVFDKSGNLLTGYPKSGEQLFQNLFQPPDPTKHDVCAMKNDGDPLVLYDQLANRWVLSQFAFNDDPAGQGLVLPPYEQCVAVSTTPDPTGQYCTYAFPISADSFNDYGKIGMRPNGYYFSYNMFTAGLASLGAGVSWMDRNAMLNCQTAAEVVFTPTTNPALVQGFGLLPADMDGPTPPPANEPEFYVDIGNGSSTLDLWKFNLDTSNLANSTFSATPTSVAVLPYSTSVPNVPQKDTTNRLDSLSDRLMYRLAYRNWGSNPPPGIPANTESLVVNHTVNVSGHAGVRWYEIRNPNGTPVVYQQATYSPDAENRWMGSAAQDKLGDLAVGYSVSGSDMYPAIRYAGRLQGDALNTLGAETSMIEGGGPAPVATATTGDPRWGDYTVLSLDPVDDCTFWYVNEYYKDTTKIPEDTVATLTRWWRTRIGSFKFSQCGANPTAAEVAYFGARWHGPGIVVSWRAATEAQTLGYNVYRSVDSGPSRRLNPLLIAAKRPRTARGAAYSFPDRSVARSKTYTYRLQVVRRTGARDWYGVGSTAVR